MGRATDVQRLSQKAARSAKQRGDLKVRWNTGSIHGRFVRSPSPFLAFVWERNPGAFNCTNRTSTSTLLMDTAHPTHQKTMRMAANFDINQFHWTVVVPAGLHKKPCIRHRVKRRFKHAFKEELKARGWDETGNPLRKFANEQLNGAMSILISSHDSWAAREVEWKEVVKLMKWTLDQFLQMRSEVPLAEPVTHQELQSKEQARTPAHTQEQANTRTGKLGEERQLFVGNLSPSCGQDDLRRFFADAGKIDRVRLVLDRATGESKRCGFVTFSRPAEAAYARATRNGKTLDGSLIRVDWPKTDTHPAQNRKAFGHVGLQIPNPPDFSRPSMDAAD